MDDEKLKEAERKKLRRRKSRHFLNCALNTNRVTQKQMQIIRQIFQLGNRHSIQADGEKLKLAKRKRKQKAKEQGE